MHPYSTSAPTGALSPNHYEIAPCFTPDDPIYENTEFDDPSSQKDAVLFRPIYQNMEFDGPEKQQQSPHSAAKKAGAESRKMEELDEDYINPEEFKIVGTEVASSTTSNNSTTQKPTTPGVLIQTTTHSSPPPPSPPSPLFSFSLFTLLSSLCSQATSSGCQAC